MHNRIMAKFERKVKSFLFGKVKIGVASQGVAEKCRRPVLNLSPNGL